MTNNPPFQLTIPADKLVDKVNDYVMVLYVLMSTEGEFVGLYTEEEVAAYMDVWVGDVPPDFQRVELTLNQLMAEG